MNEGLTPAKITDRFLAFVVDVMPFMVGYNATILIFARKMGRIPDTPETAWKVLIAWTGLFLLYQAVCNAEGATFGKRLFGVRIVRPDGNPLGIGRGILRAVGYLISTPAMNLGFLWSIVDRDSRTWHDLLAGSVVIEEERKNPAAALGSAALSFSLIGAILIGNVYFASKAPSPQDRAAVAQAQEGLRVLAAIEESYRSEHGVYTDRLADLAMASGNVEQFRDAMGKIFQPDGFIFLVTQDGYILQARARDAKKTVVTFRGP